MRSPKSDRHREKSQQPGEWDEAPAQTKHGVGESGAGLKGRTAVA